MEILIISKSRGTAGAIRVGWLSVLLGVLVIVAGTAAVAYVGYTRGGDAMAEVILHNPERSSEIWQREIILQRKFLGTLERDMDAELSALAGSVGRLQAHLTRLDAVAERMIASSKLDATEFDLGREPGIGGPYDPAAQLPRWVDLLENLDAVKSDIELRDARLTSLESLLLGRQLQDDTEPNGNPLSEGWVSSGFGYRVDPVSGRREFHNGIDFAGRVGAQVRAVAAGVVTWSGRRWGYGNLVELDHGNGYLTRYAHNRANLVQLGDKVEKNEAVALLGSTGRTTGPHVHFEVVRDSVTVNPRQFISRQAQP